MMNYFSSKKKWMAYLILLTFVFTCIVPTNLAGGNSAWADSDISTVEAVDIPGVTVKVFNYGADTDKNGTPDVNETDLAKKGYVFFHNSYGPYTDLSSLTDDEKKYESTRGSVDGMGASASDSPVENKYNRPAIKPQLVSGYPMETTYSLGYLFDDTYQKGTMSNGGGLFQLQNGYYVYNSANNAAYYNSSANKFELYNITVVPYYNDTTTSGHGGNFLPFNAISNETVEPRTTTVADGEATHRLKATSPTDNWYGMTVEFNFFMPKDGKMNNQDMIFEFSGDDDVWVFIDDSLVMDIGGTHGVQSGTINFATGKSTFTHNVVPEGGGNTDKTLDTTDGNADGVTETTLDFKNIYANSTNPNSKINDGKVTFEDYTLHTFKFFYMERGGNISNCKIKFNMPALPEGSLTVGKEVKEPDNELAKALLKNKEYTFRVLESDAEGTLKMNGTEYVAFIPENTEYSILENGVDNGKTGKVGLNGQFTLKANETAVFPGLFNNTNEHYAVAEIVDNTQYNVSCSVNGTSVTDSVNDDNIVPTGALKTEESQVVAFVNEPILYPLEITKQITDGDEGEFLAEQEYQMQVTANGILLPVGTKYTVDTVEKTIQTAGIVSIKANEKAVINGFLAGTQYGVKELNLNSLGASVTYQGETGTISKDQTASVIVTNSSTQEYISVSGEKTWVEKDSETQVKHEPVTLYLFRDGVATGQTTETAVDWSYSFDNLPRYATNATVTGEEKADGHEYEYLVAEKKLDNYAPTYKTPVKDANGNVKIDITNTYGEPETETSIQVTKIWDDNNDELGKRPQSITLNLFNGVDKDPIRTTTTSYDFGWAHEFTNLPIYDDATGKPYVYTVTEDDVDHYLSAIVPTADGFKITNTLYTGQAGQFTVNKQVEGELQPPENSEYDFNLQIKAEVVNWDAVLVSKKMELEKAHDEAYKALNGSDEDGINGATKDAKDATDEFIKKAKLTTPSAYQFVLLDGSGALFAVDRSSPSAYIWESASEVTIDPNADKGIVETVAKAIKELAQKFSNLFDKPAVFMQLLHEKVEVTTPSAVVFDKADAVKLFNAEKARIAAVELEASTKLALQNFKTDIATPSAITLKLSPSSAKLEEKTITLIPGESPLDGEGFYTVPFKLFKDTGYTFTVEATTGASIEYKISEIKWPTENYETTNIDVMNDAGKTTLSDKRFAGPYELTAKQANTFIFHNVYKTPEEPPYVPPTTEKKDPPPPPEKTNPDTTIPDENIPTGSVEPGVPLDEPEIPLGDAPATGDTNNAAPFMALLLAAIAGLVITRRKFN